MAPVVGEGIPADQFDTSAQLGVFPFHVEVWDRAVNEKPIKAMRAKADRKFIDMMTLIGGTTASRIWSNFNDWES
jgi:hypothetical protein